MAVNAVQGFGGAVALLSDGDAYRLQPTADQVFERGRFRAPSEDARWLVRARPALVQPPALLRQRRDSHWYRRAPLRS